MKIDPDTKLKIEKRLLNNNRKNRNLTNEYSEDVYNLTRISDNVNDLDVGFFLMSCILHYIMPKVVKESLYCI